MSRYVTEATPDELSSIMKLITVTKNNVSSLYMCSELRAVVTTEHQEALQRGLCAFYLKIQTS